MARQFLKFYADALDDPKLRRAVRRGRKELELLPWLLLWTRVHGENGRLFLAGEPADAEIIAESLPGVTARRVILALESLVGEEILVRDDDGVLRFANWEHLDGAKPSDSAAATRERKRRSRQQLPASSPVPSDGDGHAPSRVTQGVTSEMSRDEIVESREERVEKREESVELARDRVTAVVTEADSPSPAPTTKLATSWPGRLAQVWSQHIGLIDPGRIGKDLKPLVQAHGEAVVARAIRHYGQNLLDEGRLRFASPGDFARTAVQWVHDATPVGEGVTA